MANIVRVPVGSRRPNVAPVHRSQYGVISSIDSHLASQPPGNSGFLEQTRMLSDGGSSQDQEGGPPDIPSQPPMEMDREALETQGTALYDHGLNCSTSYDPGDPDSSFYQSTDPLGKQNASMDDFDLVKRYSRMPMACYSRRDIREGRRSYLYITILSLSIYSMLLSWLWLYAASYQPRWGRIIASNGTVSSSNASLITAMLAKTIEASFVTVFVAFLGQMLTRRAIRKQSRGMTLAEMTMQSWVIQPGSLLTHSETVRYASTTALGMAALLATVVAMFYTSASDALVSPKLKFGHWEQKVLQGYVRTSYANPGFVRENCRTPLTGLDTVHAHFSCLDVEYSGNSYHNLIPFLNTWADFGSNDSNASRDLARRPCGDASLFDNTTLTASWIEMENSNVTVSFEKYNRIINNVTMAMPHPGVFDAAIDPINGILQPKDLDGIGEYEIRASVVSPTVNVMCVNMAEAEVAPLVYTAWPHARLVKSSYAVPGQEIPPTGEGGYQSDIPRKTAAGQFLNRTVVDDIFHWGEQYGRSPPVFPLFPIDFNMVTNTSLTNVDAMYILAKINNTANYTLCELRSLVSPRCSTRFSVSGTGGGHMEAHCEDPLDADSYARTHPDEAISIEPSSDWKNLVDQWRLSIDINGGQLNSNASNARILTQLALTEPQLSTRLPSMAEALAVLASSTLVTGSLHATYRHDWSYPDNNLPAPGRLESFPATTRTQEYTCTHTSDWQAVFYAVLVLMAVLNAVCLAYFISYPGLVTDFTESANMFALAFNSPASKQLRGACGGGPEKRDLVVPWRVRYAEVENHYFFEEASEMPSRGWYRETVVEGSEQPSGVRRSFMKLSEEKGWLSFRA